MSYRLRRKESAEAGLRRIAVEQIDKAVDEATAANADRGETVHQLRKRCKKLRGLVRLVRPVFPAYARENRAFRDAARKLSGQRDAQVMLTTFDGVMDHFGEVVEPRRFAPLRRDLVIHCEIYAEDGDELGKTLDDFVRAMKAARKRAERYELEAEGFAAFGPGLLKTYARARAARDAAQAQPTVENLHEWRKRVKYHWYHTRLLRQIWPDAMAAQRRAAKHIGDRLGDAHDLAVLQDYLRAPARAGEARMLQAVAGLIEARIAAVTQEAFAEGQLLLAERPRQLRCRFEAYWTAWRANQPHAIGRAIAPARAKAASE